MKYIVYLLIFLLIILIVNSYFEKYSEEYKYEFYNNLPILPKSNIGIITFTRKPIDFSLWLKHHRSLGVSKFYIRVEDTPELEYYLKNQKDVSYEMGESDKNGDNYKTLFDRQIVYINKILKQAKTDNIDWVFNVDSDELLHGSLDFLDTTDKKIKCLKIENAEAIFNENEEHCFSAVKFLRCGLGAPCRSYANGKSGARVESGVTTTGVHRFAYNNSTDGPNTLNVPFEQLHILHFDSCSLGSWVEKYYHLSKNKKTDIPFKYYYKSIDAAEKAFDIYKEGTMTYADSVNSAFIFFK